MLESIDLSPSLTREEYAARKPNFERELFDIVRRSRQAGIPIIVLFEGLEGAGKGRAIYDLTEKVDPRVATVYPIGPARAYERERPWLWRFWMKLPGRGEIAIFDESWYRRLLVERVERKVRRKEWRAAQDEIPHFERALVDDGAILVKLFLYVDERTQKRRIARAERRGQPGLGPWRRQNRKFSRWEEAIEEMLERTSTKEASWSIVAARCGRFARAQVFETVISDVRRALDERGVPLLAPPVAAAPPASRTASSSESGAGSVELGRSGGDGRSPSHAAGRGGEGRSPSHAEGT
ncbi:hypothetical protein HY251_14750 [bacterium]|nr:hypothetical protein [bacterium]